MSSALISAHAHHVLQAVHGLTHCDPNAIDPAITRSWRRCVDQHQLDPGTRQAPCVIEHPRLKDHRAPLEHVIAAARWQMNNLHGQLGRDGHVILLTDARGVVIDSVYNDAERAAFQQAGLWLGAVWREECEGTNGVGMCLVERQQVTIHRGEHFRGRHAGLTCTASPIFDGAGNVLAVLNVSSARISETPQARFHAMALTNLSAKLIESCYFLQHDPRSYLLRLHPDPGFVGLLGEGLIHLDDNGLIASANDAALALLGADRPLVVGQPTTRLIGLTLEQLAAQAHTSPAHAWPIRLADGRTLHAQLRFPLATPRPAKNRAMPSVKSDCCLEDPTLRKGFGQALRVLEHDVSVFLHGETGTGKEAFAAALHRASSRAKRPFVAINCAAIPEALIESELFGYRGGSFMGARKEGMVGKLEQAHGGILFLDEIGDMPIALQTRLLRVLEERQVVPLGGASARALDIRVICASHQDLHVAVEQGTFRNDLLFRLAGFTVRLPPLRERADKAALIQALFGQEAAGKALQLTSDARASLAAQPWPGNVRQLRMALRTLIALCEAAVITADDVANVLRSAPTRTVPAAPLAAAERDTLLALAEEERWHMSRVAERLGVSRNTLYRKLRAHGICRR
ncbi:sigma-54-dependent Fis family transcriptional regulator [Pseudomonas sp. Marseille-QA0892]